MNKPRPLAHDLTDQGKYQLAHGEPSTTHAIVVLSDDDTIEPADGCTMEVWTTDYEDMDERPGPDDGDLVASYNVAALPYLVTALHLALRLGIDCADTVAIANDAIAKATGGAE